MCVKQNKLRIFLVLSQDKLPGRRDERNERACDCLFSLFIGLAQFCGLYIMSNFFVFIKLVKL